MRTTASIPWIVLLIPIVLAPALRADGLHADFDGDSFEDVVIGAPSAETPAGSGRVTVIYGSASRLRGGGAQQFDPATPGMPFSFGAHDFGAALATGDFNHDGFDDLAIGIPRHENRGAVVVLYGSSLGLSTAGLDALTASPSGGVAFGSALAAEDFNNDGYFDLAVGDPKETVNYLASAGVVHLYLGSPSGLFKTQTWHQDVSGVAGAAEIGDSFGFALAAADFDGDFRGDLAVGVPGEDVNGNSVANAGAVHVFYGAYYGLTSTGDHILHQDTGGVDGAAENGDRFGSVLAAGCLGSDRFADLVVGIPFEDDPLGRTDSGAVAILFGSSLGITPIGDLLWSQGTRGVHGTPEFRDRFGCAVCTGDFDGDGNDDLAVGVEDSVWYQGYNIYRAGNVHVFYSKGSGPSVSGSEVWSQANVRSGNRPFSKELFGNAVAAGDHDGNGFDDLVIGVPAEAFDGAVHALYGGPTGLTTSWSDFFTPDRFGLSNARNWGKVLR